LANQQIRCSQKFIGVLRHADFGQIAVNSGGLFRLKFDGYLLLKICQIHSHNGHGNVDEFLATFALATFD
jgi:hypothetical protein